MLKRLLFAVFVLGLVFSLSGTAISGIGQKPVEALNAIPTVNPNAQLYNDITDARPAPADFKKPLSEVREYQMSGVAPSPPGQYFCDYQHYYDDEATFVYVWGIPDAYGDDLFNMRFTVEDGIVCTLKVGWFMMLSAWMTGTPDFRAYLWDTDGFGFPGNKLDSVTIPYADIGTGTWWWAGAQWPGPAGDGSDSWVFGPGEEYHIGWTTLGGDGDTLYLASDQATGPHDGEHRSSENWNGFWGLMDDDWGAGDIMFFIESERCCADVPYTDCYSQAWDGATAYYWRAPHPSYNIIDYAQRFTIDGIDTLSSVDIKVYDMGTTPPNVSGNGNLIIKVWDDDGFGYPGNVLATEIVPAGTYPFHPSYTTVDFSSHGLVFQAEDFFVSFNSDETFPNDCEATLSDSELDEPHGRSYCIYGGSWILIGNLFGVDVDLEYTANMCRDPYNVCDLIYYDTGPVYYWTLPDAYGDVASAQLIKSVGSECHVEEVSWSLYDFNPGVAYAHDSKVSVYADAGGLPGAEVASAILTPADYVMFPGYTSVQFPAPSATIVDYYWIAIESFSPTEAEGIATVTDFGGGGWTNGAAESWAGAWGLLCDDWTGVPCDIAFLARSYHCCIPPEYRVCEDLAGTDWNTHQHDQQRTGASGESFGDAQCDLNVLWCYEHPLENIWYAGPSISGDRIACAFNNEVQVLDLATGANIYTLSGLPLGNNIRCTPTISGGVMYLSGGDQESVSAWNFATGALIWSRDITTVGPGGLFGQTRYGSYILLDQGGTLVLYVGTDDGNVVAINAANGNLFGGWATNPVNLPTGSVLKSGSTDGTNLFYNTYPGGVEGDVYSIRASDGFITWQLSTAGGLQANVVFPEGPQGGEGFNGGNSNENGVLYVNSHIGAPYHPGDGVMYAINTVDGSIKWAVPSIQTSGSRQSGCPVIDAGRIYYSGRSWWSNPPAGGMVLAFNKPTGSLAWAYSSPEYNGGYGDLALSCEGIDPDLLFHAGSAGFINTLNSVTGDEIYRRRISRGPFPNAMGLSWAISPGYLAMSDFYGTLYVLAKGVDRPRLEIQAYQPAPSVEFGPATSLHVVLSGEFTNTGCADLTFGQLETNLTANHPSLPNFVATNVRPDVMDRAASITDWLTESFSTKAVPAKREAELDDFFVRGDRGERMLNLGANAGVPFLQYATHPEAIVSPHAGDILAAGDTTDLVIDVNQSMVIRGPQDFYVVIPSDDPDFFMHGVCQPLPFGPPEIHVTIVGGCLIDTVRMAFGMGGANEQMVISTGRLACYDWPLYGFNIEGDDEVFFAGGLIYGTSQYELALSSQDWYSGGGEAESWWSMQPDPTWCDDVCAIALVENVTLSSHSTDGLTYTPIMGSQVCVTYLDSMQNFDLGGGWSWGNHGAPFDNTLTIGLVVNSRTVSALDFEPLKGITVDIMEITERNGDPVVDWRLGAFVDYDIGNDRTTLDREGSVAYQSNSGTGDVQWGMIKFPFGCGTNPNVDFEPMINGVSGDGEGMWYDFYDPPYLDSAYSWMGRAAGTVFEQPQVSDEEFHCTIARHDWVGGDTYEIAVAQFALYGTDGTSTEAVALAKLANQWLGFGRGDVDNDGLYTLADIMVVANYVNGNGPGPIPFMHLGDVNCDGAIDNDDVLYLIEWYFNDGPCPCGDWVL